MAERVEKRIEKVLYVVTWEDGSGSGEFATDTLSGLAAQVRQAGAGGRGLSFTVEEVECSLTLDEFYRAALGGADADPVPVEAHVIDDGWEDGR